MLSAVTKQAPSPSLQTFQGISGETRLLQARGFQRSPLVLQSPDLHRLRGREGRLAEQPGWAGGSGEAGAREGAAQEPRAEMLAASRRAPLAVGQVWGNPSRFTGPRGRKSRRHFSHSCPQTPTLAGVGGVGKGAGSTFPVAEPSPKTFPARPRGEGEAEAPGEARHARGTRGARWRLTSLRGARRSVPRRRLRGSTRRTPRRGGCRRGCGPSWFAGRSRREARTRLARARGSGSGSRSRSGPGSGRRGSEPAARALALSWRCEAWRPHPACRFAPPGGVPCDSHRR